MGGEKETGSVSALDCKMMDDVGNKRSTSGRLDEPECFGLQ